MVQMIRAAADLGASSSLGANPAPTTAITLNVTPPMMAMLEQISIDSHLPLERVFTKAIALYRAALTAQAEGKHVGYTDSPDELEVEFTGITNDGGA
jgi:hypothetical protein